MNNPILDSLNRFMSASFPGAGKQGTNTVHGLPLGVTASGEIGLKVITIGNADVNIDNLPKADPHTVGSLWVDGTGTPRVSQG